jgi:CRP-like cAMP-binding protein
MAELAEDARRDLLKLGHRRVCQADTVLIRQGDVGTHVFLIASAVRRVPGCAKITFTLENGTESLLGIRISGDIVGELAALRREPRSATVTITTPTVVYTIPWPAFAGFLRQHQDAWPALSRMISYRLDWANRRRVEVAGYSVLTRLARLLVELVDRHGSIGPDGYDLGVRLSQAELGKLIGAKQDAVGKAVSTLRKACVLKTRYRTIMVTDIDSLRGYAELPAAPSVPPVPRMPPRAG